VIQPPSVMPEVRGAWSDLVGIVGFQAVGFLFSMVYLTLVTRALGPSGFGVFTVFLSVVHFAFNVGVNWGQSAMVRFGKEELVRSGRIAETFWARQILLTIGLVVIGTVVLLTHSSLESYLGETGATLTWLLWPFLVLYSMADVAAWTLQAVGRMRLYAVTLVVRKIVVVLGALALIGGWIPSTVSVVVALEGLGCAAILAVATMQLSGSTFSPVRVSLSKVREIARYAWPVLGSFVAGYFTTWAHVVIINATLGTAEVGLYQAAYQFVFVLAEGAAALSTVLFPVMVAVDARRESSVIVDFYVPRLTPQLSLIWSVAVMVLIVACPVGVPLLWGSAYAETWPAFTWLLGGLAFQMVTLMYSVLFSARGLLRGVMAVNVVMSALNVGALSVAVPRWGLIGAAVVSAGCAAASAVMYLVIGNRAFGLSTWRALLGPLAVVLVLGASLVSSGTTARLLAAAIVTVITVGTAKRLRLFALTDVRWFEAVAMPRPVRRSVHATYAWLS
jgi:O-antigen/teichoic acid export membrane protein